MLNLLVGLLQLECNSCKVTDAFRSIVLDCTREGVACIYSPHVSVFSKVLEWLSIKLYQSLLDYRLVFTMSSLDVHHLSDRHTTCLPLCGWLGEVAD